MAPSAARQAILDAIARAANRAEGVLSVTLAGSFSSGVDLEGIADLDTIVVVDGLDAARFQRLQETFREELEPVLGGLGYGLRVNATLGPLKYNDPRTAVLHLMVYTAEGHREHAVKSPFTCFDWQRSGLWHKASLASVYPVFGLQPHQFFGARRGAQDYLRDLAQGAVSYRELEFGVEGCREAARSKPMTERDRHEFAYHVMRFVMQNFVKLVERSNEPDDGEPLLAKYFERFGQGRESFAALFRELRRRKQEVDFEPPLADVIERTGQFVAAFERQFREEFEQRATRHLVFRHAPTALNQPTGEDRIFQGRVDPDLIAAEEGAFGALAKAVCDERPGRAWVSGLRRAAGSMRRLSALVPGLPEPAVDERLAEIDYGACEGLSVAETRRRYPELFAAWQRGEDPCLPGGENTASVLERLRRFSEERWQPGEGPSLACSHNVVLRCLVGWLLAVPRVRWNRLRIPHLAPMRVVSTPRFGLFLDLDEAVEREIFAGFFLG